MAKCVECGSREHGDCSRPPRESIPMKVRPEVKAAADKAMAEQTERRQLRAALVMFVADERIPLSAIRSVVVAAEAARRFYVP